MKTTFARCVLIALLLQIAAAPVTGGKTKARAPITAPVQNVEASRPAGPGNGGELAALTRKLLGTWHGAACVGFLTFKADGTFERQHFTPGNNTIAGTWSIRWNALPPTLVLMSKTSDFTKDPSREEYEYLGKPLELKLLELNGEALVYRFPDGKGEMRYERREKQG